MGRLRRQFLLQPHQHRLLASVERKLEAAQFSGPWDPHAVGMGPWRLFHPKEHPRLTLRRLKFQILDQSQRRSRAREMLFFAT